MELKLAIGKAFQILDQERLRPTTTYLDHGVNWTAELQRITAQLKAGEILKPEALAIAADGSRRLNIVGMRAQDPRIVSETPDQYELVSANYELLLKLMNQVDKPDHDGFVTALLGRIMTHGDYVYTPKEYHYPEIDKRVSELPLIAEFAIRTGHTREMFQIIGTAKEPTPGLALLLMQLADTLSFNFTIFPEADLEMMVIWLQPLIQLTSPQPPPPERLVHGQRIVGPPLHKLSRDRESRIIGTQIHHILTEANQALYFYLRGALQDSPNLEIDDDRRKVIGFIESLGFNPTLTLALNEAEKNYRSGASAFELKDCMGHLRSFMENLHAEVAQTVAANINDPTPPTRWGKVIEYLRNSSVISVQEEAFVTSLYTLMSDEGVHPLIAQREYVRIRRNMTYEYGLMFLTVLEKKNLRGRVVNV